MEKDIQTSFIPKTPLDTSERSRKSGASLFMMGAVFIFIVSLVLAGAVFGGKKYLEAQLIKDKEDFAKAQEKFDSVSLDYLARLSKKIRLAKEMLSNHIVILPIFEYLEANTYRSVRFKSMDLSFSENSASSTIEISMKGEAKDFNDVARQSDVFAGNINFKNPIISDVDMTPTGEVTFNFKTQADPSPLLYKNARGINQ
mgnify:FL=1